MPLSIAGVKTQANRVKLEQTIIINGVNSLAFKSGPWKQENKRTRLRLYTIRLHKDNDINIQTNNVENKEHDNTIREMNQMTI